MVGDFRIIPFKLYSLIFKPICIPILILNPNLFIFGLILIIYFLSLNDYIFHFFLLHCHPLFFPFFLFLHFPFFLSLTYILPQVPSSHLTFIFLPLPPLFFFFLFSFFFLFTTFSFSYYHHLHNIVITFD